MNREPTQIFVKYHKVEASTDVTITPLPARDKCWICQKASFLVSLSYRKASTSDVDELKAKGISNSLELM